MNFRPNQKEKRSKGKKARTKEGREGLPTEKSEEVEVVSEEEE